MSDPQAWKYECPCGDESETFQNRATAETARRNHHIQCEETPAVVGVPYVADGGIGIIRLPYVCRTCGADTDIYGSPERGEDGDLLVGRTHRLCRNYCKECDAERTFVIAFDVAGHELEAPSYPRMPALEDEQPVATDGGLGVSDAGPDQEPPADSIVPCGDCDGRGLPDCPRCSGTGIEPRRTIRSDGGRRVCQKCEQGVLVGSDPAECTYCGHTLTVATDGGRSELQLDDRLLDAENDDDDAYVRVVTPRPDTRVDQHVVYETDDGTEQTVYDYHRGEVPASDSVVDVVYEESLEAAFGDADAMPRADILDFLRTYAIDSFVANGSKVTVYSFPRSRLDGVGEACAECEADAAAFMSSDGDEAGGNGGEQR